MTLWPFAALEDARAEIKDLKRIVEGQKAALIRASDTLAEQKRTLDTLRAAINCLNYLADDNKTLGA